MDEYIQYLGSEQYNSYLKSVLNKYNISHNHGF